MFSKKVIALLAVGLLSTALKAQYSLYLVKNSDFGASLDGWYKCISCACQPGTVEWSSAHGGSVHLLASGAPGHAGISQPIGTFICPGDTIVMRCYHSELGNFGGVNIHLAPGAPFSQAASTDGAEGYYEVRLVSQQFWSVGTMLTAGLTVWPGSGEAWIQDLELRRGGSLALLDGCIRPQSSGSARSTRAYPTPTAGVATIEFNLPCVASTEVCIYDRSGRLIRQLQVGGRAGPNSVRWDGLDVEQRHVAAGTYFYKVTTGMQTVGDGKLLVTR